MRQTKIIDSSSVVEYISYNVIEDEHINRKGRMTKEQEYSYIQHLFYYDFSKYHDLIANKYDSRIKTLKKNKAQLFRILLTNLGQYENTDKFLTLTFKENVQDVGITDNEFKKYIKRLKYYVNDEVRYIAVREQQKRGAIHYHCVFFGLPYIKHDILLDLWCKNNKFMDANKKSGVNIKEIKDNKIPLKIANYMTKYMTKYTLENDFLLGYKILLKSTNLLKPKIQKIDTDLENIIDLTKYENTKEYYKTNSYKYLKINKILDTNIKMCYHLVDRKE